MDRRDDQGAANGAACQPINQLLANDTAVNAICQQIESALKKLRECGKTTTLDLRSQPINRETIAELEALLGRGELEATLHANGPSKIWETAVPAVWWVVHQGGSGNELCRFIEITRLPLLLQTPECELDSANERLRSRAQTLREAREI